MTTEFIPDEDAEFDGGFVTKAEVREMIEEAVSRAVATVSRAVEDWRQRVVKAADACLEGRQDFTARLEELSGDDHEEQQEVPGADF